MNKLDIGLLGEKYAMLLLSKRGIDTIKLPNNFASDIICSNGLRIEIKTSNILKETKRNKREYYCFHLHNKQIKHIQDYYIFICLNESFELEKYYIVPKDKIKDRNIISIPKIFKNKKTYNGFTLQEFENNIETFK